MKISVTATPTTEPIRRKNWLKSGTVLLASVIIHGLFLLTLSLFGGNGLFGSGQTGNGIGDGDSLILTWIPGGGRGGTVGGGRLDTVVPDAENDGSAEPGATVEAQPEPKSDQSPLVTMVPKDPKDVFTSDPNERLVVEANDDSSTNPRLKIRKRTPVPVDPAESEMSESNPRQVSVASARTFGETGTVPDEIDGQGTGRGKAQGDGTGDGDGSGQGTGGSAGKGGSGVNFFGIFSKARRVVYLIDASESMRQHGAMQLAREKLLNSLQDLPANAQFQIVFFNLNTHALNRPGEKLKLLSATPQNLTLARQFVNGIQPDSGTDRLAALNQGLSLDPDVIYLLTDADAPVLTAAQLFDVQRRNYKRKVKIHVVEFGVGADLARDSFLKQLCRENYGTHFYHDLGQSER